MESGSLPWRRNFYEILCLARMHGLELWVVSCLLGHPCFGLFPFLSRVAPLDWHPVASPVSKDDEQVAYRHMSLADS